MPYFRIDNEPGLVFTNFKVMFSSFKKHAPFQKMKRIEAWARLLSGRPHVYFTVRNPYDRVVSFYKDKFQKIPMNADLTQPYKWEKPQRVFFPLLQISTKTHSNEAIRQRLLDTSFASFVEMLEQIYWLDEHIQPQHWLIENPQYRFLKRLNISVKRFSIFKMDDPEDMQRFCHATGFSSATRANSSEQVKKKLLLTPDILASINAIYKEDFERYGYTQRLS
ncbi:MAG: hypothetical protein ABS22_09430 [SAR92 bacterium BACL16 MAG-120322-bin99]|jgi:hypothetical protein|nr:MAG: hypothetical protein ABS22_09430 [SAR92 bacterium BACL16 MAG-120322-bin99]